MWGVYLQKVLLISLHPVLQLYCITSHVTIIMFAEQRPNVGKKKAAEKPVVWFLISPVCTHLYKFRQGQE